MNKALFREKTFYIKSNSEPETMRHFMKLSKDVFGVSNGFYPLGSCTMKYNPALNEKVSSLSGFTDVHPLQDGSDVQGCLAVIYKLISSLCALTGMSDGTLAPCAGAQGEYTGLKIIRKARPGRNTILVPDSAHGTNPASAGVNGFNVVHINSGEDGLVDFDDLKSKLNSDVAGLMLTNPNTLGLYEHKIKKISDAVHKAGGLMYYDGANFNALVGTASIRDSGFDVLHLNLHKTFSTPHGGGGPGSGPVLVSEDLIKYLPYRVEEKIQKGKTVYSVRLGKAQSDSIGRVSMFYGNFSVAVKAYAYILSMGADGLREVSETAVLNARYLQKKLSALFDIPFGKSPCMHEFVISLQNLKNDTSVTALDFAKALLDRGVHAPTVYFPLIVHEALMIEPTESENLETLDYFCDVMSELHRASYDNPEKLKNAPETTPTARVDDVKAVKYPVLSFKDENKKE